MEPTRVDFRNVWHEKNKKVIRSEFTDKQNLHLRGLYWLAQDVIGDDPADQDSIAPEATELKRLRNLLEHRCLILREMNMGDFMGPVETANRSSFTKGTLHIVKLARCALMYLAFSIRKEEADRRKLENEDTVIPGMPLPILQLKTEKEIASATQSSPLDLLQLTASAAEPEEPYHPIHHRSSLKVKPPPLMNSSTALSPARADVAH